MKSDQTYVLDILIHERNAKKFAGEATYQEFLEDEMRAAAICRSFEIMGEASKRLSQDFRQSHAQVDWSGLAKFRDVLIHGYDRLEYEAIWNVIQNDLPEIIFELEKIVPPSTG